MNHANQQNRFFDQILRELELGNAGYAVTMLAGVFDGIIAADAEIEAWRSALLSHALSDLVCNATRDDIRNAIAALGFARALTAREELTVRATIQAHGAGKSTATLASLKHGSRFQLIAAPSLPDQFSAGNLVPELITLRDHLTNDGAIILSSLVPGHLGIGWNAICNGHRPQTYDERSLSQVASGAGLHLTHFRDASDCLVWAVLRDHALRTSSKGENDGQ